MAKPREVKDTAPEAREGGGVWNKIGWLELFDRGVATVKKGLPAFTHSIQVAAAGGPKCDIRRLWYLVASAALGRFRNRVRTLGASVSMDATWDITGKVCSLEIAYQMNAISNIDPTAGNLGDPGASPMALLIRGPEQLTVGGDWTGSFVPPAARGAGGLVTIKRAPMTWLARLTASVDGCIRDPAGSKPVRVRPVGETLADHGAKQTGAATGGDMIVSLLRELPDGKAGIIRSENTGIPVATLKVDMYEYRVTYPAFDRVFTAGELGVAAGGRSVTAFPDSGRIITTVEKNHPLVQSPKPPVDGHTRCGLLALVAQALQTPCFLPTTPPCTKNPAASAGYYAQPPGTPSSASVTDIAALWAAVPNGRAVWPLDKNVGPDGYPNGSTEVVNYGD